MKSMSLKYDYKKGKLCAPKHLLKMDFGEHQRKFAWYTFAGITFIYWALSRFTDGNAINIQLVLGVIQYKGTGFWNWSRDPKPDIPFQQHLIEHPFVFDQTSMADRPLGSSAETRS